MESSSVPFARLTDPQPLTVVARGHRVLAKDLSSAQWTVADLMSLLRKHGVHSLDGVTLAILEPQGRISVISREPAVDGVPV
jgi:uncharacterized membrane protein YcaP (DUF421 family)